MKKLSLIIASIFIGLTSYSQTLTKIVDEMSDKVYWSDDGQIYIKDDAGFRIECAWKYNSKEPVFDGIMAKVVGLGSCVENVEMIVLFDNSEKVTVTSWNKFNCEGNAWFSLKNNELELFKTVPITKIRFTNGRTYDSITGELDMSDYFIKINKRAENGDFDLIRQ
jgi:hypothetical protein